MWDKFAPFYKNTDFTTQTFFYTLINMLDLPSSKHILEVGCGTGQLLPQAVQLKPKETTDLSPNMLKQSKSNLEGYLSMLGVTDSVEDWMGKQNLTLQIANGEQKVDFPFKFDRIIANLVLHHADDPLKMVNNLHEMAEEGWLLAVHEMSSDETNDFLRHVPESHKAKG